MIDYQELFEKAPFKAFILDPDIHIIAATDSHLIATGTSRDQIIGRYVWDVFPDNPEDPNSQESREGLQNSFDIVKNTLRMHRAPLMRFDVPADDETFITKYWAPTNSPILNEDGTLKYIFNLVDDITNPMKAIMALKSVGGSLRDASDMISELLQVLEGQGHPE